MKISSFEKFLNGVLWAVFLALATYSYFLSKDFSAPEYEVVTLDVRFPYDYIDKEGARIQSEYQLAWYHPQFKKPTIVAYDPSNDKVSTIKDEYLPEYQAIMPASQYKFIHRCFWVVFALLVIVSGIFVYFAGGFVRDNILYMYVKNTPIFENVAYFLHTESDRLACVKEVEALIPVSIDKYIAQESLIVYRKYKKEFADLIMQFLWQIRQQNSTKINFYYLFDVNVQPHHLYLSELLLNLTTTTQSYPALKDDIEMVRKACEKKYIDINLDGISANEFSGAVAIQLDKMFTDVMGTPIFTFYPKHISNANSYQTFSSIFVKVTVLNSFISFTWSGNQIPAGTYIPGLNVRLELFHYLDGKPCMLWSKTLPAQCSYTVDENSTFSKKELFQNIVRTTISTFAKNINS